VQRALLLTLCASFCLLSLAPLLPGDEQEVPAYSPEVQAKLEELRARGEPVTLEDLTPDPIPPEENAATIYRRAFAAYVDRDEKVTQLISLPFQDRSTEQL